MSRRPSVAAPLLRALGAIALAFACAPRAAAAQTPADPRTPRAEECWRFAFGQWTPPLDARASGHESTFGAQRPSGMTSGRAAPDPPPARDFAARVPAPGDSVLLLFPAWWPAGIELQFAPAPGDTLRGRAVAYVADARQQNPRAAAIAWRVSCAPPPRAPAAPPSRSPASPAAPAP